MQTTNETIEQSTIAKVFAAYMPCDIAHSDKETAKLIGVVETAAHFIHNKTGSYGMCHVSRAGQLLLTPLSCISDEHAIGISTVLFPDIDFPSREQTIGYVKNALSYNVLGKGWLGDKYDTGEARFIITWINFQNLTKAIEILQQLGYDLPMHILNGKTPIECGIAIDKTKMKEHGKD